MGYKATVIPAVKLTKDNFTYTLHKGDILDTVIFNFAHGKVALDDAEILDFELKIAAAKKNRVGNVFDTLSTHYPAIDNVGNFRDSSMWFDVKSILVGNFKNAQSDKEIIAIDVDKIDTIAGTFTNEDGTTTYGVDLTSEDTSLPEIISNAVENDMIVISEGDVTDEISVNTGVTLNGNNAGVPQNHEQEVA